MGLDFIKSPVLWPSKNLIRREVVGGTNDPIKNQDIVEVCVTN